MLPTYLPTYTYTHAYTLAVRTERIQDSYTRLANSSRRRDDRYIPTPFRFFVDCVRLTLTSVEPLPPPLVVTAYPFVAPHVDVRTSVGDEHEARHPATRLFALRRSCQRTAQPHTTIHKPQTENGVCSCRNIDYFVPRSHIS